MARPSISKFAVPVIVALPFAILSAFLYRQGLEKTKNVREYTDAASRIEREFLTHVPIYEDFATPEMEMSMRKFLLMDHLRVGEKIGVKPPASDEEIKNSKIRARWSR